MTLAALLAWYDEPPTFLYRAVTTAIERAGADVIVAVDGRYALLGDDDVPVESPREQFDAIVEATRGTTAMLVHHRPVEPWPTEMEKRTRLFALAESVLDRDRDWMLVLDADFEVVRADRLRERLAAAAARDLHVAEILLHTPPGPARRGRVGCPTLMPMRAVFSTRESPIRVDGNHYTYVGRGGRLWGTGGREFVPAADLLADVLIVHWTWHRPERRVERQYAYYRARDASGDERTPCERCGERLAVALVPTDIRDLGSRVDGAWVPVCEGCEPAAVEDAARQCVRIGVSTDYAGFRVPLVVE